MTLPARLSQYKSVFLFLFLSLTTLTVVAIGSQRKTNVRPKAAEETPAKLSPTPAIVPGEVLVGFSPLAGPLEEKPSVASQRSLTKSALTYNEIEEKSIPVPLKIVNEKVKFKSVEAVFKNPSIAQTTAASDAESGTLPRIYKLSFDPTIPVETVISSLSTSREIDFVEPNYIVKSQRDSNDPYYLDRYPQAVQHRDPAWNPEFDYQWGLRKMNIPQAWDTTTGSSSVKVAVIDTGIDYTHQDFGACNTTQVSANECERILPGYDFINDDNDPYDDHGHGSHVGGIIGAASNNSFGIAGINWSVKLLPIKVLDAGGSGPNDGVSQGIIYAANHGANIINMSLGYGPNKFMSKTQQAAIDYAYAKGVTIVAAAGNAGEDMDQGFWPGAYEKVIAVGASSTDDTRASFSNFGSRLDVIAPGTNILSVHAVNTLLDRPNSIEGRKFISLNGTSMAAPAVSGIAALLLSKNSSLKPEEIRQYLRTSTDDVYTPGFDDQSGYGRVNAGRALQKTIPPIAFISSPIKHKKIATGSTISIQGTASTRTSVQYFLEAGSGMYPTSWSQKGVILQNGGLQQVANGSLGTISTAGWADGTYTIRLRVTERGTGLSSEWRKSIDIVSGIRAGFPFEAPEKIFGSPLIADINNDKKKEIIFSSFDGSMFALDSNGKTLPGWPVQLAELVVASPAIVDILGDRQQEIIVSSTPDGEKGTLSVYKADGTLAWRAQTPYMTGIPVVGRFTQAAKLEVAVVTTGGDLHIYGADGSVHLTQHLTFTEEAPFTAPAIADTNGDGIEELFIGGKSPNDTAYSYQPAFIGLFAYQASTNSVIRQKTYTLPQCTFYGYLELDRIVPSLGDINNDGRLDMVVGCLGSSQLIAYQVDNDQTPLWKYRRQDFSYETYYPFNFTAPISLANIDTDPELELIVPASIIRLDTDVLASVVVFEHDGTVKSKWPHPFDPYVFNYTPSLIADIDNDGTNDIVNAKAEYADTFISSALYAFKSDKSILAGWPKTVEGRVEGTAIGDLDGNGTLEVAATTLGGYLYVWDTPGKASQKLQWSTYLHDLRHTSFYGTPVRADTIGVYRPNSSQFHVRRTNTSGNADLSTTFGTSGDKPLTGDWDGDGVDTFGVYRANQFLLSNSEKSTTADIAFAYGQAGDIPVSGDWDGDGIDTIGVFRNGAFYLRNTNDTGSSDITLSFGVAGDKPVAGDWDADGIDTVGVYRGNVFYMRNTNTSGPAEIVAAYGVSGDQPVVGDWNGDGKDTVGVKRGNTMYLRNENTSGSAHTTLLFGLQNDIPIAGKWRTAPAPTGILISPMPTILISPTPEPSSAVPSKSPFPTSPLLSPTP